MDTYPKENLEEYSSKDLMTLLDEGDTIEELYIKRFCGFSSFTRLPYDTIGRNETRVIFSKPISRENYKADYGPISATIIKKFQHIFVAVIN